MNNITKSDLSDIDFIDAQELLSDGYYTNAGNYLNTTLVSTTTGTNIVVINLPPDNEGIAYKSEHRAEVDDIVWLFGTSGGLADGYYNIGSIIDDTSFTTNQPINTSSGGQIAFYYPSGSKRVGFNPENTTNITANNVQEAIEQLDIAINGPAGGDLNGTYPNPNVVDLTISGEQYGSILFFNGTNWVQLSPEDDGYVLTTHDIGAQPTWEPSTAMPTATMPGQILIANDALQFIPTYPLSNDNGLILLGDEGQVLIPS